MFFIEIAWSPSSELLPGQAHCFVNYSIGLDKSRLNRTCPMAALVLPATLMAMSWSNDVPHPFESLKESSHENFICGCIT